MLLSFASLTASQAVLHVSTAPVPTEYDVDAYWVLGVME